MKRVQISVMGRAVSEPGPAAIGVQAVDETGKELFQIGEPVGNATSEYAEYTAVVRGLQQVAELLSKSGEKVVCELQLSNQTVKQQLGGEVVMTHPGLVPLFIEVHNLRVTHFPNLQLLLATPKQNKAVSRLVAEALNNLTYICHP